MMNRNVGFLISGISVLIILIVYLFNKGLTDIVADTCTHGSACTMYDTISAQTNLSLAIAGVILVIGLFFIFTKEPERIIIKKIRKKKIDISKLDKDEKLVMNFLMKEGRAVFQSDLMEKLKIGKVKTTRLLDKLEAKQFVERKRRGMNNIVILKD